MSRAVALATLELAPLRDERVYRVRLVLFTVYALVSARFVLTSLSAGDLPLRLGVLAWLLVCVLLVARRSLEVVLAALVLAPVVSYLGLLFRSFGVAAAFLPFSCASLVWIGHRLCARPRDLAEPSRIEWIADCLGLVIVVKSLVALVTPSIQNSIWRLATLPSDYPYSEMQAMNVGFYLTSMLCLFGILTLELRVDRERASSRLQAAILLQLAAVTLLALAQAALGLPGLVRDGLHAPFVGIHEMGFYAASLTTFVAVMTLSRPTGLPLRTLVPALVAAAALLGASFSRTGWIATLAVVAAWALLACRREGRVSLSLSTLAAASAVLAATELPAGRPMRSPAPRQRVFQTQWLGHAANRERLSLFGKAAVLAAERPLDGVGIGDFRITDDERTAALVGWMDPASRRDHDAHNIVLNLASEAGLGAAALFLCLVAGAALVGVAQGLAGRPVGHAAAAAVTAGLLCNLVNCVITWPWQALTYGMLLTLPLAGARPAPSRVAGAAHEPDSLVPAGTSRRSWPILLPLVPVAFGVLLSPWSVHQDDLLQRARFGFLRWDWFPPGPSFVACQPNCRVPLETAAPVAAVRVRPGPELTRSGQLRLTLKVDGVPVASEIIVPRDGIVVSVPGRARKSLTLELTTRHVWKSWAWGLHTQEFWVVDLLDVRGARLPSPSQASSAGDHVASKGRLSCRAA